MKNHSFSDGNKRIATILFLWFLDRNDIHYRPDGTKRIAGNMLVALTPTPDDCQTVLWLCMPIAF